MKNLVMGVAKSYAWKDLEPFVASCKKNCPDTEIVMFVDDISDFTRAQLIREGVKLIDISSTLKAVMIINLRWKMYLDFLEQFGDNYAQIFVADTRDVVFQGDPFAPFKNFSKWLGYPTELETIGGRYKVNYNWLVSRFGKAEADKLVDKQIICCGTVIASNNEMKIFCRMMWDALQDDTVWGHEQAVMNYLVHNNLLPIENLIELDVNSGAIFTNAQIKNNKTQGDFILRGDGGIPAVVHQYDRHAELVRLVDKVYRDKNFSADERFTDPRSVLEQAEHLLFLGKINDTARLFLNVDDKNFGEEINRLSKLWERILSNVLVPAIGYLEFSVQNALLTARNISFQQLNKICMLLIHSVKNRRAVLPRFKLVIAQHLVTVLEQTVKANLAEPSFQCIDFVNALDVPPNKNFYFLAADAYKTFGRKEQALAAYKKALELD